jgi:polar amino acid transport system substrate-binding protein
MQLVIKLAQTGLATLIKQHLKSEVAIRVRALIVALAVAFWLQPASGDETRSITVYLPVAPPLTAASPSSPRYAQDITARALTGCGYDVQFNFLPWKRAQQLVLQDSGTLVIPLARSPEREARFRWIVPVVTYHSALVSLGEPLNSIADISPAMRVAAVSGTAHWDFLLAQGVAREQMVEMISSRSIVEMLAVGRIDVWLEGIPEAYFRFRNSELKPDLVVGAPLLVSDLYIAAGLDFPDDQAQAIKNCVDNFKQTDEYAELIADYLPRRTFLEGKKGERD